MIPKQVITIDRNAQSACSEISAHDGAKYATKAFTTTPRPRKISPLGAVALAEY
jgi:hypothetical protein